MKAILSADLNWGIGYKGNLLLRIAEDMKFFKQTTLGKTVVMGRETFLSLPGQQPLKDRVNIVMSRNPEFSKDGIVTCHSIEELMKYSQDDMFVIGGESIYKMLLPYCSSVYVTKIEKEFEADRFFVNLDMEPGWKIAAEGETKEYNGVKFRFLEYVNLGGSLSSSI